MRVHELAKELAIDSRRLIALLKRLGVDVRNHMSTLEDDQVQRVRDIVSGKAAAESAPEQEAKPAGGSPVGGQPPAKPKPMTVVRSPHAAANPIRPRQPLSSPRPVGDRPTFTPSSGLPAARSTSSFGPPPSASTFRPTTGFAPTAEPAGPVSFEPPRRDGGRPSGKDERNSRSTWMEREDRGNLRKLTPVRRKKSARPSQPRPDRTVIIDGPMTVSTLSQRFGVAAAEIIKQLMQLGILATINQEVDADTAEVMAAEFGLKTEVRAAKPDLEETLEAAQEINPEAQETRAPVVTVMGHVDHGKTSLLDAYRETRVTQQEAGGITQHIGAYTVSLHGKKIVFLDTPGHEAFTAMRARGAGLTDIAVLVVAADDGVMPQTVEAISHAKAAGVPIVVAMNKMDRPDANPERLRQQLSEHGLISEEWGGETIMVPVSAKTGEGLDQLLEMLLLVAEVLDLKADPTQAARGTVIEAQLDKGRGPVATVLVQNGTLHVGDIFVAGSVFGRVRALFDDKGKAIKRAGPATPVEVVGSADLPDSGDRLVVVTDERLARQVADQRAQRDRLESSAGISRGSLEELYAKIAEGDVRELKMVLKGDVHGSVEAVKEALGRLARQDVHVQVLHDGVGAINESDITLASASQAVVVGFNVRPTPSAKRLADVEGVEIRTYRVIYELLEEIEAAMKGLLAPTLREVILGHAEVRQVFHVSKIGTVAGLYVTDGKLARSASVRLVRDGTIVHEGKVDSLRRFKDDAREVTAGMECGLTLDKFNDFKVGDTLEVLTVEEVPVT